MSATRAFALRSALRAARNRPIQSQARISLSRRGYASIQGAAHQAAHQAGSDLPWLATSAVISIPTLAYLLYNGSGQKSHDEHASEAGDHGVAHAKPKKEVGEGHEPTPTSHTDTGDAESKGDATGNKPEGVNGGHEDQEEGAQPQDNEASDQAKNESQEGDKDTKKDADKKDDDGSAADESDKGRDKTQSDEQAADQKGSEDNANKGKTDSSGKDSKKSGGEMDDSTESQEKKLSEKPSSKKVKPTDK
ncbi:hypothetical protein BR93DRAFT_925587 [Coniochaeta sp. PMI_546]|nr:hypothetical protein BR93DRAFT_925587 [Coniochaeta sp. PMI_546]